MAYTNVPKPTGANYTNTNPLGREQYDDPLVEYDDADTFYDGVNYGAYTNISKPTGAGYEDETWAEMTLPWSEADNQWQDSYIRISKPS